MFQRLAEKADVVVENFRPDVKAKLGIDYESVRKINPRIVYGSISGFGQDGPYHKRPGFDQIAQGMGGLMSITGAPGEGPMRVGIPVADLTGRAVLRHRHPHRAAGARRLRRGPVGADLAAAGADLHAGFPGRALADGKGRRQAGRQQPSDQHPDRRVQDLRRLHQYRHHRRADLGTLRAGDRRARTRRADPDYATAPARSKNRDALNAEINELTEKKSTETWVKELNAAGVPCGPIYSIDQMFEDAQVKHLGIAQDVPNAENRHIRLVGQPVTLSRTPSKMAARPPEFGEQTDEVLAEFGFSAAEIAELRQARWCEVSLAGDRTVGYADSLRRPPQPSDAAERLVDHAARTTARSPAS